MLKRLGFTTRIFLLTTLLVALALGVAAVATYVVGARIATQSANASLEHSRAVQQNVQVLDFQRLGLMTQMLANDPAFLSYVVEAGGNNPFGNTSPGEGVNSITNLLNERQAEIGFDLGMVLDPSGNPIAQSHGTAVISGNLDADTVVTASMQAQSETTGFWLRDGHIYQVAVAPLGNRDQLAGYLVLGLAVTQAQLQNVKRVSGSDLVMLSVVNGRYTALASTLDTQHLGFLTGALNAHIPATHGVFPLELGNERWLASAHPLNSHGDTGIALTLTSLDKAMAGFRAILTALVAAAILALLLALLLSWWLSRQVSRPLRRLAEAAQEAARGDYQRHFPASKAGAEIAQLTQALDSLLSDLREKSEIESYMADLAKYQPDVAEHPTNAHLHTATQSAGSLTGAYLAVRLHDSLEADHTLPDKAVLAFNTVLRTLDMLARQRGGRLVASAGNRAYLAFDELKAALLTAGMIVNFTGAWRKYFSIAVARGKIITGPVAVTLGGGTSVLGAPMRELEELLSDAPTGTLVASRELAESAQAMLGANITAVTGHLSSHTLSALELPAPAEPVASAGDTLMNTKLITPSGADQAQQPRLMPGALLGERYEILADLGSGGMARVYKARDRQLNEVVALKTLKFDSTRHPHLLESMKTELRLLRKISHRNLLRIYDFDVIDGLPVISMEYVRGMTLKYMLENRARLPHAAGLRILRQVCAALAAAHAEGVLHRDIKPDNVMLEPSGNVKLMDFGVAMPLRYGDTANSDAVIMGTPRYAAPEQLQGKPLDERADLYACGVMLYRMFTGKLPFDQRQLGEMLGHKIKEQYQPPESLVANLPVTIAGVITVCLRGKPEQRPSSAEALLRLLESIRV